MNIPCCDAFEAAQQPASDGMYGILIHNFKGEFVIGTESPAMKFCPWCGADVRKKHPLEIAARAVVEARYDTDDWGNLNEAIGKLADVLDTPPPTG